jgi:hypothetical protein
VLHAFEYPGHVLMGHMSDGSLGHVAYATWHAVYHVASVSGRPTDLLFEAHLERLEQRGCGVPVMPVRCALEVYSRVTVRRGITVLRGNHGTGQSLNWLDGAKSKWSPSA